MYYEKVVGSGANAKKASNWIMSEMLARVEDIQEVSSFIVTPENMSELLKLIDNNIISGKIAKDVFEIMVQTGKSPNAIVEEKGLKQVTDTGAIEAFVDKAIAENPGSVSDYKAGKDKALKFLVGQVMKESKGKANPALVNEILLKKLKGN